jgi:hypothetical protein
MHLASYRLAPIQAGVLFRHAPDAQSSVDIEPLCDLAEFVSSDSQRDIPLVFRGRCLVGQELTNRLANRSANLIRSKSQFLSKGQFLRDLGRIS